MKIDVRLIADSRPARAVILTLHTPPQLFVPLMQNLQKEVNLLSAKFDAEKARNEGRTQGKFGLIEITSFEADGHKFYFCSIARDEGIQVLQFPSEEALNNFYDRIMAEIEVMHSPEFN